MRIALVLAGAAFLVAGCGGSPAPSASGTATTNGPLAFARCMRSHGVPSFPDPDAHGDFPAFDTGVSKQISSAANDACKHLMNTGGTATPQQGQQKLEFGLKVAQCLRAHGFPTMPDPTADGSNNLPRSIDTRSPQFQAAETTCEKLERKAMGLS